MRWHDRDPWRRWPVVVLFAGLAVTIAGVVVTARLYGQSERRLLDQQTREAGAVLTAAASRTETVLTDAAMLADATQGDPARFETFAAAMTERSGFAGAALVDAGAASTPVATGGEPLIGPGELPDRVAALVDDAVAAPGTIQVALLEGSARRLGYATTSTDATTYVVYAESPLPATPTRLGRSDGPFSDIDYAIYLGEQERSSSLLYTSVDEVPLASPKSVITLPFAESGLTFTSTAAGPLSGRFAQAAPWMLAIGGTLVSLFATLGTRSVLRRGHAAEQLADRLAQLTTQQRAGIATLRSSLLPRRLDPPHGVALHTGYWPADRDHEVSGDFYDAFRVGDRRWAIVIGDVCGKGADAAALTGLTRHTIRAAARHLRSPSEVLRWTHEAIAASGASTFVTVCFAFVDLGDDGTTRMHITLGGHPAPLLWRDGTVVGIGEHGSLLGLVPPTLRSTTVELRPGDVVMLYTDGLTDVAGSALDTDELATIVGAVLEREPPERLAVELQNELRRVRPAGTSDDSAILIAHVTGHHQAEPVQDQTSAATGSTTGASAGSPTASMAG